MSKNNVQKYIDTKSNLAKNLLINVKIEKD